MPPTAGPKSAARLRERIAALNPRERRFLAGGAAALLIFLLYLLWPSANSGDVELAEAPPPAMQPTFSPPIAAPAPLPTAPAAPPPPLASSSAAAGVILRGVMGGGPSGGAAIFAFPEGSQRVVRVGRELLPGMILREIGVTHAIASSAGGDIRMDLNKAGGRVLAEAPPVAATPPGGAASAGAPATAAGEALRYRLGLAPMKVEGRIRGFSIRPNASLPMLERAGLRAGDVLVSVNGQAVESEEKVLELPQEIAGAYTAEFEFIRGGRRMKTAMEVNKRPGS